MTVVVVVGVVGLFPILVVVAPVPVEAVVAAVALLLQVSVAQPAAGAAVLAAGDDILPSAVLVDADGQADVLVAAQVAAVNLLAAQTGDTEMAADGHVGFELLYLQV